MTRAWLIEAVGILKLYKGADFKAIDSNDIPKPAKFVAWIPDTSKEPALILKMLAVQNTILKTGERSIIDVKRDARMIQLVLYADPSVLWVPRTCLVSSGSHTENLKTVFCLTIT